MKLLAPPQWENPYFEEWRILYEEPLGFGGTPLEGGSIEAFVFRDRALRQYAWAIPTPEAIACVAKYSPILEVGAGRGYWTRLLRRAGADVLAFDDLSWEMNGFASLWADVLEGSLELVRPNSHRALFLCWPPYDLPLARHALGRYQGGTVIYIGEGSEGCTADEGFHDRLWHGWMAIEKIDLPQHYGLHDYLIVYRRKPLYFSLNNNAINMP